jgi:Cytochrome c3
MFLISSPTARRLRVLGTLALCCSALAGSALFAASGSAASPAVAAPAAARVASTKAAPSPEARAQRERIEKAALGVAGLHRGSSGTMKCEKCHGGSGDAVAPDDNQTVENRECASCHDGYDAVAALSAKKLSNAALNPHASHLGPEVACTACHQGHQVSKAYCEHCHTNFSMPMPGNKPATR